MGKQQASQNLSNKLIRAQLAETLIWVVRLHMRLNHTSSSSKRNFLWACENISPSLFASVRGGSAQKLVGCLIYLNKLKTDNKAKHNN